ncbi:MAG: ATP-binding cassette domain-containing protein [Deltaproteobacteria bacterium]|nr:ATP-binding cassette domain-containing protein [Deltaproteobacteria bacterium]MBW2595530.1 ATP-binding cassette domain-containing protein [Deltaproteobacteria bacterium]MBW2649905.1 ATP-binding cassette domain-containing protein [Deltaproteobacteria bacterium]
MALVSLKDVTISFGGPVLLEAADWQIERGERICLIGRNGTGKSTLLRLIHGELFPDSGMMTKTLGLRTALLPQEVPLDLDGTVYDIISSGQPHRQVQTVISRMNLDETAEYGTLSAGLQRRVLLARALVSDPDILMLDEPTNHLDIDSIIWMEQFLLRSGKTIIFVTHDRAFLNRVSTRIVELDRGVLTSFAGNYDDYLTRKEELIENEASRNAEFDKHLGREEIWVRQGIKARRTRNEGRVRALMKMRAEVEKRRARSGNLRLMMQEAERSGRLVIKARNIAVAYDNHPLITDFSTTVMRGDKIGVIGPNGCGKTTLLRILLREIDPDSGSVRHGTRLQVAYFDQLRAQLDESKTLQENVTDEGDMVTVNGKPRHVIGYLQDFLFSPAQARGPITSLSGGERNRLLLARLFTRSSNVLVLDEPTNDLDGESLELLEAMLIEYTGTVLLVSHDRAFLNNVATSTLVFEGSGRVEEYAGGYDDGLLQRSRPEETTLEPKPKKGRPRSVPSGPRKLTFKEQREREKLPGIIEDLEARKRDLFAAMADPELYKTAGTKVARLQAGLDELERELEAAYARWELLEDLALKTDG